MKMVKEVEVRGLFGRERGGGGGERGEVIVSGRDESFERCEREGVELRGLL